MSLLKNDFDLEEYARQCTLQRRHYEACVQNAQIDSTMDVSTVQVKILAHYTPVEQSIDPPVFEQCFDDTTRSCVLDLLEASMEPLAWEEGHQSLDKPTRSNTEDHQAKDDRPQRTHQTVTNSTGKSVSSMSYGAP